MNTSQFHFAGRSAYGGSPCENMHVSHALACAVSTQPIERKIDAAVKQRLGELEAGIREEVVAKMDDTSVEDAG